MKRVYLAIDTAYQIGIVAVFSGNIVHFAQPLPNKMGHGKNICGALDAAVRFCEKNQIFLAGIFVGLGPGSFVGLRISLATALGFGFAQSLPVLGFCSHRALAMSLDSPSKHFRLFMKASGDLGYATDYIVYNGQISETKNTRVMDVKECMNTLSDRVMIYSDMGEKLGDGSELDIKILLGPNERGVVGAARERLSWPLIDESDVIKPNYVKPPNVSVQKSSANCVHRVD